MRDDPRKFIVPLVLFLLSLYYCVQLLMVPSNGSLEYKEEMVLTATTMVKDMNYSKAVGFTTRYYIRYEGGSYSVLVKAKSKGDASVSVSLSEKATFTLYASPEKVSKYRLVEQGTTLEEHLKEERSPYSMWAIAYFVLGLICIKKLYFY